LAVRKNRAAGASKYDIVHRRKDDRAFCAGGNGPGVSNENNPKHLMSRFNSGYAQYR